MEGLKLGMFVCQHVFPEMPDQRQLAAADLQGILQPLPRQFLLSQLKESAEVVDAPARGCSLAAVTRRMAS